MWRLPAGQRAFQQRTLRPVLGLNSSLAGSAAAPEEWRVLRLLSLYRLLLVALIIGLLKSGTAGYLFDDLEPLWTSSAALFYGVIALLLMGILLLRRPPLRTQAHLHVLGDVLGLTLLIFAFGGVPTGLGALVITPVVGGALVLSPRMATLQAAIATLAMIGMEFARRYDPRFDGYDFTASGVLGLMLFAASVAANAVAQRARVSEALAERVGSEFENLSRLNESIVASLQTGVLVVSADGEIRRLNDAARRLLHLESALNQQIDAVAPGLALRLQQWQDSGEPDLSPVSPRADAADVVPRFSRLGTSEQASVLIMLEDAGVLQQQAQQLKLAALGRLSANIAHEIRNPLSAINHAGQLLAEADLFSTPGQQQNRRLLDMIQRHGQRIEKIVSDVLALSRREPPNPSLITLQTWLVRTAGLYQESQDQPRPIEFLGTAADLQVRFDPDHLQQVVFNLWDNAFRHGGDTVVVLVDAGRDASGRPWLEVIDDGPGIAESLRDSIFEPFFTTAHQGTGLGLFLTRELCEYNQARISYRASEPRGARFRLTFALQAA